MMAEQNKDEASVSMEAQLEKISATIESVSKEVVCFFVIVLSLFQGGRTWQAFSGDKNGHETFRQARIYNFRDKCIVFARNLKFSNLTQ